MENALNYKERLAFGKIEFICEEREYYEIADALYSYMKAYKEGYMFDAGIFEDEIENYLGIRGHENIVNYINNEDFSYLELKN